LPAVPHEHVDIVRRQEFDEIWSRVPPERRLDPHALELAVETARSANSISETGTARVLDLGCGDGGVTAELAHAGALVTGVDVSGVAIERARANHPALDFVIVSAGEALPFGDAVFDAVVCLHVLEHVANTQHLLSEARRVLAPGGHLAVAVPFHGVVKNVLIALRSFERYHNPLGPVRRFYTRRSLGRLLNDFGFEHTRLRAVGGLPFLRETLLARAQRA
jgi:2-polyprenyl-3-methyl-5-hydroxy-6-metoxy-1,4-benzoquinol methylase